MTIGAGILLTVIGAILRYAVSDQVENIDLAMIGLILMVAGVAGILIGAFVELSRRRTGVVARRDYVVDRTDEPRTF